MYHDFLPENNLEKVYFRDIAKRLPHLNIVSKNFDDPMPESCRDIQDKILLINADESYRIPKEVNDPSVRLIFKQYCHENQHSKVRPLPLGSSLELENAPYINIRDRKYDVSFVGNFFINRFHIHDAIFRILSDLSLKCFFGLYQGFNRGLPKDCYKELMAETKIAICPEGTNGPETFRFFEAMQNSCIVIAPKMIDNWIYRDSPHVLMGDIYAQVKSILKSDMDKMSNESLEYYKKNVSAESIVNYILGELS